MTLSSDQLEGFLAVAQTGSFSMGANKIHLTQSALSQRVAQLEAHLGESLFVRDRRKIRLTEMGRQLLSFCLSRQAMEQEFLAKSKSQSAQGELIGSITVASFSTYSRSKLIPILGSFARTHRRVQLNILVQEIHELPATLRNGDAEIVISTEPIRRPDTNNIRLSDEVNVLVESSKWPTPKDRYLDHDHEDITTQLFFNQQTRAPEKWSRLYFEEIYSIMDAAAEGLGRAVVPQHLAVKHKGLRIIRGMSALNIPTFLNHLRRDYMSSLEKALIAAILKEDGSTAR